MTLTEFIDDHFLDADIRVLSAAGAEVGTIPQGDESGLRPVRDYLGGEVVKDGRSPDGSLWVYVTAKPRPPERGPVLQGYPGDVSDEAAFSLDWRSREPKASPKQVAYLYKNIRAYLMIRKAQWPQDPQYLLRYEASDAMTAIIEMKRKKGGDKNG